MKNPFDPPVRDASSDAPRRTNSIPWLVRLFAAVMAISGYSIAPYAIIVPPFWFGFFLWMTWFAIAFNVDDFHRIEVWGFSFAWNLMIVMILCLGGRFHPVWPSIHAAVATLLSGYCMFMLPQSVEPER